VVGGTSLRKILVLLVFVCLSLLVATTFFRGGERMEGAPPSFEKRENEFWGSHPELGEGRVTYTVVPVELEYIEEIVPIGKIGTIGHPIPTSHTYWVLARKDLGFPEDGFSKPVRAPADGVITKIIFTYWAGFPDYGIYLRHTNTFMTAFYHLSELSEGVLAKIGSPLREGYGGNEVYVPVKAGDIIGKTSSAMGQSACLDMGAYDREVLNFIHPEKYPLPQQHAISPLDLFSPSLQERVYEKVKRTAEPRGGECDYDLRGKLSGNWFLEGTDGCTGENGYQNYLSFGYDVYDPRQLRISLGWKFLEAFGFPSWLPPLSRVEGNAPDFKNVGVNSGRIVYRLSPVREENLAPLPETTCTLLVEMMDEEEIRVEVFQGNVQNPSFTQRALIYTR